MLLKKKNRSETITDKKIAKHNSKEVVHHWKELVLLIQRKSHPIPSLISYLETSLICNDYFKIKTKSNMTFNIAHNGTLITYPDDNKQSINDMICLRNTYSTCILLLVDHFKISSPLPRINCISHTDVCRYGENSP